MNAPRKYPLIVAGVLSLALLCAFSFIAARKKALSYQATIVNQNDETQNLIGTWQRGNGTLLILKPNGTGCFQSPSGKTYQGFDWTCKNGEFWFTQYGSHKPNLTNLAKLKRILFDDTSMQIGSAITELNGDELGLRALSGNTIVHNYVRVP